MGQCYKVITRNGSGTTVYNRYVDGEYTMPKLLEHSWWDNSFCRAFSETLVDNPTKVCWCGDYAEPDECTKLGFDYESVWGYDEGSSIQSSDFSLDSVAYLVNNDKKLFVDLAKYKAASERQGWIIYPVSLLTALGNGRGCGDYHKYEPMVGYKNEPMVGSWAFDEIYLTNTLPTGYAEITPIFTEY